MDKIVQDETGYNEERKVVMKLKLENLQDKLSKLKSDDEREKQVMVKLLEEILELTKEMAVSGGRRSRRTSRKRQSRRKQRR